MKNFESRMEKLLNEYKSKNNLDFRRHKYLQNDYNLTPAFSYDFAEEMVLNLNNFLTEKFGEKLVIYNLKMDCESLRITSLKNYAENRIMQYLLNHEII